MATTTVIQEAAKLVAMKRKVDLLLDEIAMIKQKLVPYVATSPLQAAGGTVSMVKGSQSLYLSKKKMRDVLQNVLKLSAVMVDKIMLLGAERKIINDYVKVTLER